MIEILIWCSLYLYIHVILIHVILIHVIDFLLFNIHSCDCHVIHVILIHVIEYDRDTDLVFSISLYSCYTDPCYTDSCDRLSTLQTMMT